MPTKSAYEKAIQATMKATGQSREEVIRANPALNPSEPAATREPRNAGPTREPYMPAGAHSDW